MKIDKQIIYNAIITATKGNLHNDNFAVIGDFAVGILVQCSDPLGDDVMNLVSYCDYKRSNYGNKSIIFPKQN